MISITARQGAPEIKQKTEYNYYRKTKVIERNLIPNQYYVVKLFTTSWICINYLHLHKYS